MVRSRSLLRISLPQVVRTMRAKQLDGISSASHWLPALVNGPVAIVILHRLAVARHDTPDPGMQQ
jgi:hypothetical protein